MFYKNKNFNDFEFILEKNKDKKTAKLLPKSPNQILVKFDEFLELAKYNSAQISLFDNEKTSLEEKSKNKLFSKIKDKMNLFSKNNFNSAEDNFVVKNFTNDNFYFKFIPFYNHLGEKFFAYLEIDSQRLEFLERNFDSNIIDLVSNFKILHIEAENTLTNSRKIEIEDFFSACKKYINNNVIAIS